MMLAPAVVGAVAAALVLGAGPAAAAGKTALLSGSTSAKLTQLNAREWTTTVYLDTAALCAGKVPAVNDFSLVTGTPNSVSRDYHPVYDGGGAPKCDAQVSHPVTEVTLTFTPAPALSAVPQTATLTVTPPPAMLAQQGEAPDQIQLTVRRTVSPWQYVIIPALCGLGLALLFVVVLLLVGIPGETDAASADPASADPASADPASADPASPIAGGADPDSATAASPTAGGAGRRMRRGWNRGFWAMPLFAGATWSFGDSWATSVTPLGTLVTGVLATSGAIAGLVPGVDLSRFALLITLVGGIAVLAPLLFGALNTLFPDRAPAPAGKVFAARLWVMLVASCVTVIAVGAELGFVGWVLGFNLVVASASIRWCAPAIAAFAALLFLFYALHEIRSLAAAPDGGPKPTAMKSSFML